MKTESDDLENAIFTFEWWRDSAGYEFANESRSAIRRKGGAMESYSPDIEAPTLYKEFLAINREDLTTTLDFINKYGFMGTVYGGADSEQETVSGIMLSHFELVIFDSHVMQKTTDKEKMEAFNKFSPAHMTLKLKQSHGKLIFQIAPRSLISWMWLRLAQVATGEIKTRNCERERCQKPFYIGKNHGTERKWFCSDHCRAMSKQENNRKLEKEAKIS